MNCTRPGSLALALACLVVSHACGDGSDEGSEARGARGPNILLIVTDDQRWDSVAEMPMLDARSDWARFTQAFVNVPQCCPSRATILTGRYSQNTLVTTLADGAKLDEDLTAATMLHDAGYRTGFFGKYVNGYPFGRGHYIPPGWDRFAAYEGPTEYFDYDLNEDGTLVEYGSAEDDYSTDVFVAQSREFIRRTDASQPLFLYAAFNAPHFSPANQGFALPAPRHTGSCADRTFEPPPSFNASDTVDEPAWLSEAVPLDAGFIALQRQATCETLRGVDEAVTSILDELDRAGRLEDTYVVFTSDNGYSFGEHRLVGKGHLYEESVRVPLLVSGPGVKTGPIDRLTSNVDLVPTMLEWAKVAAPADFVDGTSFAGALRGRSSESAPEEVLLRGCRTKLDRSAPDQEQAEREAVCGGYREGMGLNWGLRTATHKYVEYPSGEVQLFDLRTDPFEMTNLANDPAQADLIADLEERLARRRRA